MPLSYNSDNPLHGNRLQIMGPVQPFRIPLQPWQSGPLVFSLLAPMATVLLSTQLAKQQDTSAILLLSLCASL